MTWAMWAVAQVILGGEWEPRHVRIEAADERLSAILARAGGEIGVALRLVGAWDPRVTPGVREGTLWQVLDALAREVGARPERARGQPPQLWRGADLSPVAYAGPFRIALRAVRVWRAVGEHATPGAGVLTTQAWPEPGRKPLSFEWVVDRLEVGGEPVEATVEMVRDEEIRVHFPVERTGELRLEGRVRGLYLEGLATARLPFENFRRASEVQVGGHLVRVRPAEQGDEREWVLQAVGAGEESRLGVAAPGICVIDWTAQEVGPGERRVLLEWGDTPEEEQEVTVWYAEGVRRHEWEVEFEPIALPGLE